MVKFLGLLDPLSLGLSQFHEDETTMNIATPFGLGCLAHQISINVSWFPFDIQGCREHS